VPLLGDIPVLGWLFKRTSSRENKTNLLIFITPHIIKNAEDLERVTRRARRDMNEFQDVDMTDEASRKVWTDQQFNLEGAAPELMEN
jgi:general secretion pathway protein D